MSRAQIKVAAGVLSDATGRYLAAQRPVGKIAAGKWEFPGGKIESGESPEQALHRELKEELGIEVCECRPLIRIRHAYTDRDVEMWVYLVTQWNGIIHPHDGQAFYWGGVSALRNLDLLGADGPILRALELPSLLPVTPPDSDGDQLHALARRWRAEGITLARLRLPSLNDAQYHQLAAPLIAESGVGWILDRCPKTTWALAAAGFHATAHSLQQFEQRPVPPTMFFGASCHDRASWSRARERGCDYAFLSPIQHTATHPQQTPLGWEKFAAIIAAGSLPTYALGGMVREDVTRAHSAWAQGISGIRLFA